MEKVRDEAAEAAILRLVEARGPDKSICPTDAAALISEYGTVEAVLDAARRLDGAAWRSQLGRGRAAAAALARSGRIEILRKGKPVPLDAVRGVIRLRVRGG